MDAQRAELSWDANQKKWLARIVIGEEVIRRHIDEPESADKASLAAAAVKVASDEGYSVDPSDVSFA